jgi:predicted SAM-dependent methyltransferase
MIRKLNLGCGKTNFGSDWIHIDKTNYSHIHSNNIIDLPFDDDSIEIIYSSHTIEYFDREEIIELLKKWKQKLKKNGILRLSVPNFKVYTKLYNEEKINLKQCLGPFYGKWKTENDTNYIYHKTVYDYDELYNILESVGFKNIKLWDWKNTEHSHIDDYSQAYIPHMDKVNGILMSLNIECSK